MSSHLLPIMRSVDTPFQYISTGLTGSSLSSGLTCMNNREIYIGLLIDNTTFSITKLDLLTSIMHHVVDIPKSSLGGNPPACILADDDYIYITTSNKSPQFYRVNLKTNVIDIKSGSGKVSYNIACYRKMIWYNDHTIAFANFQGFTLYDTENGTWTEYSQSNSYNTMDFAVGKKTMLMTQNLSNVYSILRYDIEENTFSTFSINSNTSSVICYKDGKYYIAYTNYLYIYDEETKTFYDKETGEWTDDITNGFHPMVVPWNNPKCIVCSNNALCVICSNSQHFWIFDLQTLLYRQFILPFTIPSLDTSTLTRTCAFENYFFIPYWTIHIVHYSTPMKYNLGYKVGQYIIIYNKENADAGKFKYDERFVTFHDTYVEVHDGDVEKKVEPIDEERGLYKISVDKSEYMKLNGISMIVGDASDNEGESKEDTE